MLHLKRHVPVPVPERLGRIDAVLISHAHGDHLDLPSLRRLGRETKAIAPAGTGPLLRRASLAAVTELLPGDEVRVGETVTVRAVPATHDGRRYPWSRETATIGFEIRGSRSVYFAGDTDLFEEMGRMMDPPDLALLPIWGWGHRLGAGHMDPRGAARAAALLRPGLTVPIHWGTYFPAGMKGIRGRLLEKPAVAFGRQMGELAPDLDFRILTPGESVPVPAASS